MARAVIVCSECGKELTPTDMFCPHCGVKIVREGMPESAGPEITCVLCNACGHKNSHGEEYCESCGVKLADAFRPRQTDSPVSDRRIARSAGKQAATGKSNLSKQSSFKFETWHYGIGVVILLLAGVFTYLELQREYPPDVAVQSPPMKFPSSEAQSTPPSKEVLEAIERLEKSVKENPADAGAKLLLANALHDGAMHDGRLFPRAIEAYRNYLKEKPGDPNARVDLGICYFELGKIDSTRSGDLFSQAINEMESTMKTNPKHQAGAFNLAIVYLYYGNMQASNTWLQKTVELNPESDLGKRAKAILQQHGQAG